nr:acyltransferase family protein [Enterococcus sp. DIV0660C]
MRGFAICCVVMIHCLPQSVDSIFIRSFLNHAVPLFLYLSGINSSMENYKPKKRVKKVVFSYIIWSLIYTLLYNYGEPQLFRKFFLSLVTFNSASGMYFIPVYIQLTLLIPIIDKMGSSRYKSIFLLISPIETFFSRIIPIFSGYHFSNLMANIRINSCLPWFSFFYLGYLVGNNKIYMKKKKEKKMILLYVILLFLSFFEGYLLFQYSPEVGVSALKLSSVLASMVFLMMISKVIKCKKKIKIDVLKYIGDYSFSIFFLHLVIIQVFNRSQMYRLFPFNALVVLIISLVFSFSSKLFCCFISWNSSTPIKQFFDSFLNFFVSGVAVVNLS